MFDKVSSEYKHEVPSTTASFLHIAHGHPTRIQDLHTFVLVRHRSPKIHSVLPACSSAQHTAIVQTYHYFELQIFTEFFMAFMIFFRMLYLCKVFLIVGNEAQFEKDPSKESSRSKQSTCKQSKNKIT